MSDFPTTKPRVRFGQQSNLQNSQPARAQEPQPTQPFRGDYGGVGDSSEIKPWETTKPEPMKEPAIPAQQPSSQQDAFRQQLWAGVGELPGIKSSWGSIQETKKEPAFPESPRMGTNPTSWERTPANIQTPLEQKEPKSSDFHRMETDDFQPRTYPPPQMERMMQPQSPEPKKMETNHISQGSVDKFGIKGAPDSLLVRKLQECKLQLFDPTHLKVNEQTKNLLYSQRTWQDLNVPDKIRRGLIMNGFDMPSWIQTVALDILFKGRNLIAQSQSGTGKTVAFVIGLLNRIDPDLHIPQAVILEPTYELAKQTAQVIRSLVENAMNVGIAEAVRGTKPGSGYVIKEHIVVGTPGTVLDWLNRYKVFDPKKIRVFVLDEADVMIGHQGHQDQSVRIYKTLDQEIVQTALFSATYDTQVMEFAKKVVRNPELITVKTEELSLENIHQYCITVATDDEKIEALRSLYGVVTVDNAIVFCRSREMAHRIYDTLKPDGHPMGILAGDMPIEQRDTAINRFRDGLDRLLITTNVSARGIDIMSVNLVLNFDLPLTPDRQPDFETYIHRIGRTGRFGRGGLAVNFVKDESDKRVLNAFQKHFKREIKPLDHTDIDKLEKLNEEATKQGC